MSRFLTELEQDLIEELRVANTNCTLVVADVVVLMHSRSEVLKELARVRKTLTAVTRERDSARRELRRVLAVVAFKIPEGAAS